MKSENSRLFEQLPETLSIAQLARKLNVNSTTVRQWIRKYLLEQPEKRTEGGGHVTGSRRGALALTHEQIAKLTFISILKDQASATKLGNIRIEVGLNSPDWFSKHETLITKKLQVPLPRRN
ncbi:MAG: MerR family transcriptional regulator [Candidatus Woesebacteria bacterium]